MALLRLLRLPAGPGLLHRHRVYLPGGIAGLLELALGVPAGSSCFLLRPLCPLEMSAMLPVSQAPTVWAGSALSAAPLFLQHGAQPLGPQATSAGLARGSFSGTTWFLLLTSRTAPTSSHKRAAGGVVAARRWGDKEDMEEGVEDIIVMRAGGGDQVEEEEDTIG